MYCCIRNVTSQAVDPIGGRDVILPGTRSTPLSPAVRRAGRSNCKYYESAMNTVEPSLPLVLYPTLINVLCETIFLEITTFWREEEGSPVFNTGFARSFSKTAYIKISDHKTTVIYKVDINVHCTNKQQKQQFSQRR